MDRLIVASFSGMPRGKMQFKTGTMRRGIIPSITRTWMISAYDDGCSNIYSITKDIIIDTFESRQAET